MTANELADAMEIRASIRKKATNRKSVQENANDRLADQLTQAATMLRKQQAEIEALKSDTIPYRDLHQVVKNVLAQPMRELSDEEIMKLWKHKYEDTYSDVLIDFARAILKKASKK